MYDNDYIVLIDENGQPYIAHAWRDWVRSAPAAAKNAARTAGRKATKYIEKIVDKGKARYFYTQDELKAYYNNARNKAASTYKNAKENLGRTVDRVTGLGVRKDLSTAEKRLEESRRKADREQRRMDQALKVTWAAGDLVDKRRAAKYDASIAYQTALDASWEALSNVNAADDRAKDAAQKRDSLKQTWDEMGDQAHERIALALSSGARDRRDKVYKEFLHAGIDAEDARTIADAAVKNYETAMKRRDEAETEYQQRSDELDAAHATQQAQADRYHDAIYRRDLAKIQASNDASTVNFLKDIYAGTPLGRIESMANSAKNAFNSAKDTVSRWGDTALDSIGSVANSAKDKASDAVNSAKNAAKEALGYGAKERMEAAERERARAKDAMDEESARGRAAYQRSTSPGDAADQASDRRDAAYRENLQKWLDAGTDYRRSSAAYNSSPAAVIDRATEKAKTISASAAKALQEKWQAGKELTQNEMNQLMSFLMKDYK